MFATYTQKHIAFTLKSSRPTFFYTCLHINIKHWSVSTTHIQFYAWICSIHCIITTHKICQYTTHKLLSVYNTFKSSLAFKYTCINKYPDCRYEELRYPGCLRTVVTLPQLPTVPNAHSGLLQHSRSAFILHRGPVSSALQKHTTKTQCKNLTDLQSVNAQY